MCDQGLKAGVHNMSLPQHTSDPVKHISISIGALAMHHDKLQTNNFSIASCCELALGDNWGQVDNYVIHNTQTTLKS